MDQSNITIKKVILSKGYGVKIEFTEREKDDSFTVNVKDCSAPAHQDLRDAFNRLNVHLGINAQYIDADDIKDIEDPEHELLGAFTVKEMTVNGDWEGVTLGGKIKLKTGKSMGLKPPAVMWEDKNPYPFMDDLAEAAEQLKTEALRYLGGKHAPETQLSMFNDEQEEDEGNGSGSEEAEEEEEFMPAVPDHVAAQNRRNKNRGGTEEA